eukprot:EG_transcript_5009
MPALLWVHGPRPEDAEAGAAVAPAPAPKPPPEEAGPRAAARRSCVAVFLQALTGAVFCLGVVAGVLVFLALQRSQQEALQAAFEQEAASLGASVASRIQCFTQTSQMLSGAMTLQPNVSRRQFAALVTLGKTLVEGIYGTSWIPRVRYADRDAFVAAAQAEWPGFNITPWTPEPEYMVVYLIEPIGPNRASVGFNLFSNPSRRAAMEKARDTGAPVVTSRLRLVQEQESNVWGVLYTIAVYGSLQPPANLTLAERRALHIGYVNGVIRIKSLVKDSAANYAAEGFVEWFLFDLNALQEDGSRNQSLLYTSGLNGVLTPDDVAPLEVPLVRHSIDIGTRSWSLLMRPRDTLVARYKTTTPIIWMATVFLVTLLLCAGVLLIANKVRLDAALRAERTQLLDRLLPAQVSEFMMRRRTSRMAQTQPACCVLFMDVAGFTAFSSVLPAGTVVLFLKELFNTIDVHCGQHRIEKIKTIGDCYMAANGLFGEASLEENATRMLTCALRVIEDCQPILDRHGLAMRGGVHGGEALCGLLGGTKPYFDLWGDTVNMASRLESSSLPGRVQVAAALHDLLAATHPEFHFVPRPEKVVLKGKGPTRTWFAALAAGPPPPSNVRPGWA